MPARPHLALTLLSAAALTASAQTASPTPKPTPPLTAQFNRNLIYIDPAHGGPDPGAHLTSQLLEKDVTLTLALKLKESLTAKGFTVLLARQADDPGTALATLDDRAGLANHARPVACLLLHATPASRGAQLYVSSLVSLDMDPKVLPWDSAQSLWVPQSLRLASELGGALTRAHIPTLIHRADPKPLSSLTCPAVALEIAPLPGDGSSTPVSDPGYQQRLADSVANAMIFWKGHADPRPNPNAPVAKPVPRPRPAPAVEAPATPKLKPAPKPAPAPAAPAAQPDADPRPARMERPSSAKTSGTEPTT